MERKDIKELTEEEAKEILETVYPDEDVAFDKIHFEEPERDEDGMRQVTFGLRSIIGIAFRAGLNWDGCMLHFDDTRVVNWLYKNGYEIGPLLESNKDMSKIEMDLENLAYDIHWHCEVNPKSLKEKDKEGYYTLEKTRELLLESANKYYYGTDY